MYFVAVPDDAKVSEIRILTGDQQKTIEWDPISVTGRCTDIQYSIDIISDVGEPLTELISETSFVIPENIYCFVLSYQVTPVIGGIMAQSTSGSATEGD